jgi:hypothetical protein
MLADRATSDAPGLQTTANIEARLLTQPASDEAQNPDTNL